MAFTPRNRRKRSFKERLSDIASLAKGVGARVAPWVALAAVALAIPFAAFEAYVYAISSPYFSVKSIEIEGLDTVERGEFLRRIQLSEGMNVFDVDIERIEVLGEAEPWVASVEAERSLPDTVELKITERVASAVVIDGEYLVAEESGEVFKALEPDDPVELLLEKPLITGIAREDLKTDEGRALFRDALATVTAYHRMEISKKHPISEVHVDPVMGVSMVTADGIGTEIRLGKGKIGQRLKRLAVVFRSLDEDQLEADYILIDHEENLDRVVVGTRTFASKDASEAEVGDTK